MHDPKGIFLYLSVVFIHNCLDFEAQHSDDLGDRKLLRTDFGVVWYTSIYLEEEIKNTLARYMEDDRKNTLASYLQDKRNNTLASYLEDNRKNTLASYLEDNRNMTGRIH